jgi:hypothetical protein
MTPVITGAMEREGGLVMRSQLLKAGLLTAVCTMLTGASATAATLEVTVPFPFVVQGETMPAGQYRVVNDPEGIVQFIGERGNHATILVLTIPASGYDPAGTSPALTFSRDRSLFRFTGIWESATEGREVESPGGVSTTGKATVKATALATR